MATFNGIVTANADDVLLYGSTFYNGIGLYIGTPGTACSSALRFDNVTIPAGATIDNAYLTVDAYATTSGTGCNLTIALHDADDPSAPTNATEFTSATRTSATTAWNNVADWTATNAYNSPDFKSAVQEVIDRGGWNSGQAIVVFLDYASSTTYRQITEYEARNASYTEARITIDYTEGGGGGAASRLTKYAQNIPHMHGNNRFIRIGR